MRRQFLTLFLTLIILVSIGGAVSIVGAASHATSSQVIKPTIKTDTCNFIGDSHIGVFYSSQCPEVKYIKPEYRVCFKSASEALALDYRPSMHCHFKL